MQCTHAAELVRALVWDVQLLRSSAWSRDLSLWMPLAPGIPEVGSGCLQSVRGKLCPAQALCWPS
eukprot:4491119-Alexandrium_andersonii.AAC.1